MEPYHRSGYGLALACAVISAQFGVSPCAGRSMFTPMPAQGAPSQFTPEMRALVADESARLKRERPELNAKERKRLARAAVLELSK